MLKALYLAEQMVRLTERLERGRIIQSRRNSEVAERLGVAPENLMGRIFAALLPEASVVAAAVARGAGAKVATGRHDAVEPLRRIRPGGP
ncbi:hypothetical protein ACFVDQ_37195 [Streptomyces sp. NPDC057684]|uniref:hypothetical protein n=1 Tax=unclassified Streptomyces TaxID=2593676 RepID=UPI0036C4D54A